MANLQKVVESFPGVIVEEGIAALVPHHDNYMANDRRQRS